MYKIKSVLIICCAINLQLTGASNVYPVCQDNFLFNIQTHEQITDLANYCQENGKGKFCVSKCCGEHEMLSPRKINRTMDFTTCVRWSDNELVVNYSSLIVYDESSTSGKVGTRTNKNFAKDFHWVQNKLFKRKECSERWYLTETRLLENGKIAFELSDESWQVTEPTYYCTDLAYSKKANRFITIFFVVTEDSSTSDRKNLFSAIASIISATFLVSVLLCYCALPQLQNLSGMLLMAYVSTQIIYCLIKAVIIFFSSKMPCTGIATGYYFCCLSTFFWLSIMSFDIWWAFRGQRLRRRINRRGELVKFLLYSLVGWGIPLLMSGAALAVDYYRDFLPQNMVKPYFDTCINPRLSSSYYIHVPIAILTLINITLFLMTIYNMLLIKNKLDSFKDSSTSMRRNQNRFRSYIKLSLVMGTSWLLEIVQMPLGVFPLGVFIAVNAYNLLIGVFVFVVFICNKRILRMLCKRFNIHWRYLEGNRYEPKSSRCGFASSTSKGIYNNQTDESDVELSNMEVSLNPNPFK